MTSVAATAATSTNSALNNYLTQQTSTVATDKAAASSSSSATDTANSAATTWGNFNTYLKILTTQLKNQDPTSATDTNQFTQELVQFAGVEQQIGTNSKLDTLISLQKGTGSTTAALNYMGSFTEVTTTGNSVPLQNSEAEIGYTLSAGESNAAITIKDGNGNVVTTLSGSTNAGKNYVTWNGTDSNGNKVGDGTYTFSINVTNSSGASVAPTDTRIIGQVTGVSTDSSGNTILSLGGVTANVSSVDAVYDASSAAPATTKTAKSSS